MARAAQQRDIGGLIQRLRNPRIHDGEQRSAARLECRWHGRLVHEGLNVACVVEDISDAGCRLSLNGEVITPGTFAILRVPDQKVVLDGVVAWTRAGEIGLRFLYGPESRDLSRS